MPMLLFPVPFKPFLIALGLLTRIPVPQRQPASDQEIGHSVLAYPLVGLLIGSLLVSMAHLPLTMGHDLQAALLLTFWVWITGGLHLDGLADSADAWVGGMENSQRTLEIMQDPRSGPIAIITLVLLLLVKFATIKTLLLLDRQWLLILPPLLGRSAILLLFITTAYVRRQGMGAIAARYLPKKMAIFLVLSIGSGIILGYEKQGVTVVLVFISAFMLLRKQMQQRIGGTTGDSAGALCELLETITLLAVVLV